MHLFWTFIYYSNCVYFHLISTKLKSLVLITCPINKNCVVFRLHTKIDLSWIDLSSLWESVHIHLDRSQFAFERSHSDHFNSLVWMAPTCISLSCEAFKLTCPIKFLPEVLCMFLHSLIVNTNNLKKKSIESFKFSLLTISNCSFLRKTSMTVAKKIQGSIHGFYGMPDSVWID